MSRCFVQTCHVAFAAATQSHALGMRLGCALLLACCAPPRCPAASPLTACSKWLLAPDGGNLMGETLLGSGPAATGRGDSTPAGAGAGSAAPPGVVDFSNAYRQDGSPNPAHRLWCCVLSLLAVLQAALPGHAAGGRSAAGLPAGVQARLYVVRHALPAPP